MFKTIAVIVSTVLFSLIGLLAGYVAMSHIDPGPGDQYSGNSTGLGMMLLVFGPTFAGAILGLVVGCVAVFVGKQGDGTGR